MDALIAQYTDADEHSRLTRQYIAQLEYDTTMHLLNGYLGKGKDVCELGAATGRYSLEFASQGCNVTAVELVPDQVRILKENALKQGLVLDVYEGNACHVPFIEDESQDLCVILGPLYHLKTVHERQQAIQEAKRILKPGGVLAIAYISKFFVAGLFAQRFSHLITPEVLDELNSKGTVSCDEADSFFQVGYFASPGEMETLVTQSGFSILLHAATDSFSRYLDSGVNSLTPSQYQAWLSYHLSTCLEPSLLGASNHGLVLAKMGD
ncbi:biotin synthesis protein bioC [Vibrio maritimus]|uniref:Biotin synthesis protein bioC n=1 Tax=Vibrio maritimus TaxID=990268 RepID=A0A090T5M6_9VIBR|nr:biotin synthesis protein bioC [Vibrio maritimus]